MKNIFLEDDLRIYNINMKHNILKNCLLIQVTIPLYMISTKIIYSLIHLLLTLRIFLKSLNEYMF